MGNSTNALLSSESRLTLHLLALDLLFCYFCPLFAIFTTVHMLSLDFEFQLWFLVVFLSLQ